jgi:hypothetical protein
MPFPTPGGGGSGEVLSRLINQVNHNFNVGDWVYLSGASTYSLADADVPTTADSIGVVTAVPDIDNFTLSVEGYVTGLSGLTPTSAHFLSSTPGAITDVEPTGVSTTRKPVLIADTATSGWMIDRTGTPVVGSTAVVEYISLTATIGQSVALSTGSDIIFSNQVITGGIPYNAGTGVFTLTAGKSYRMSAAFRGINGSVANAEINIQFVDAGTNTALTGSPQSSLVRADPPSTNAGKTTIDFVYTPNTNQTVKLRVVSGTGTVVIEWNKSSVTIVQIGASPVPMDLAGEYGESNITNLATATATLSDIAGSSFTLPSAGVWEVDYYIFSSHSIDFQSLAVGIYDSSNTLVGNSLAVFAGDAVTGGATRRAYSNTARITTTGPATYKLRGQTSSGSVSIYNNTNTTTGGQSKVAWKKIAGFLPSTGQTVDTLSLSRTGTNQSGVGSGVDIILNNVVAGNIPYNTTTGVVTLTAGKTYKLDSSLYFESFSSSTGVVIYSWVDATTNTQLVSSQSGYVLPVTHTAQAALNPSLTMIYTPSADQTIKLRGLAGGVGTASLWATRSSVTIQQLGSSATTLTPRAYVLANKIATQSFASFTNVPVTGWNEQVDATASFDPTTGTFTALRTGYYTVATKLSLTSASTPAGTTFRLNVSVTGVSARTVEVSATFAQATFTAQSAISGATTLHMTAGDTLNVLFTNGASAARSNSLGGTDNNLSIIEETITF